MIQLVSNLAAVKKTKIFQSLYESPNVVFSQTQLFGDMVCHGSEAGWVSFGRIPIEIFGQINKVVVSSVYIPPFEKSGKDIGGK